MGFDKIVRPLGLRSPLARVAAALGQRRALIVVPPNLSDEAARIAPAARIVINRERARGMAHSLHLALSLIERESPFGVLLGDMPSMTEATIDRTEAMLCGDVDVAFPVDLAGTAGHPVLFSARARTIVEGLSRRPRMERSLQSLTCQRSVGEKGRIKVSVPHRLFTLEVMRSRNRAAPCAINRNDRPDSLRLA